MFDFLAAAFPLLADADTGAGVAGGIAGGITIAGLLGTILYWLLWTHLPLKDRQLQTLMESKDAQIAGLIAAKDAALLKQAEYHKAVVDAVTKTCNEQVTYERIGSEKRTGDLLTEIKSQHRDQVEWLNKIHTATRENIHALRNFENTLRLRTQLADAMTSLDLATWVKTLEGVIISWNPAAERLLGWRSGEIVGTSVYDRLVPADYHAEEAKMLKAIGAGETVEEYESERLNRGRQRVKLLLKTSPVQTREGRVVAVSTIARLAPLEES